MIVKWVSTALLAGALAFTFITPASVSTNSIKKVQIRPDIRLEFRHMTPVSAAVNTIHRVQIRSDNRFEFRYLTPSAVSANTIHVAKLRPDIRLEFRHITPADPVIVTDTELISGPGPDKASKAYDSYNNQIEQQRRLDAILRDDGEVMEIISMIVSSGILDDF